MSNPYKHRDIVDAERVLGVAQKFLADTFARVQKACTHDKVVVARTYSGYRLDRKCLICGLEEPNTYESFHTGVLNTEFTKKVDSIYMAFK